MIDLCGLCFGVSCLDKHLMYGVVNFKCINTTFKLLRIRMVKGVEVFIYFFKILV